MELWKRFDWFSGSIILVFPNRNHQPTLGLNNHVPHRWNTKNWVPKKPSQKMEIEKKITQRNAVFFFRKLMPCLLFRDNLFFEPGRRERERERERKFPSTWEVFHLGNGDCFGILDETFWQDQKLLRCVEYLSLWRWGGTKHSKQRICEDNGWEWDNAFNVSVPSHALDNYKFTNDSTWKDKRWCNASNKSN